jgi:hypothetical protein
MYAKQTVKVPKRRERRRHSDEFKRQVVAACRQPGISMAAVALANGLNANLLRRWVNELDGGPIAQSVPVRGDVAQRPSPTTLVPVTISGPDVGAPAEIQIEIQRPNTVVRITWPVTEAAACAPWLRELLR